MFRLRRLSAAAFCLLASVGLPAAALGACGKDDPNAPPKGCTAIVGGKVTLVGQNLAWNEDCLKVPVGTAVTFNVVLADVGVQHDLEVYGPSGRAKTALEVGPTTQTLVFTFSAAGPHTFDCSIHATMVGHIYVEAA